MSGRLEIRGDILWHGNDERTGWSVDIHNIAVIGAYTTEAGPYLDDYFLVFVARDQMVYEVPIDAVGTKDCLAVLADRLHTTLRPALANSAAWKTQILWPESLRNQPLLVMEELTDNSMWGRLRRRLFRARTMGVLSEPVKKLLKE